MTTKKYRCTWCKDNPQESPDGHVCEVTMTAPYDTYDVKPYACVMSGTLGEDADGPVPWELVEE